MILFWVLALFAIGHCTGISDSYSEYEDILDSYSKSRVIDGYQNYGQQSYINNGRYLNYESQREGYNDGGLRLGDRKYEGRNEKNNNENGYLNGYNNRNSDKYDGNNYGVELDGFDGYDGEDKYDGGSDYVYGPDNRDGNKYSDGYDGRRYNENKYNIVGIGNGDEENLMRPCALDDRQCIRKFFAENSMCKPAYGPIPDPLYLKRNTIYIPFANISVILTRFRVTGLSSIQVSEFYVNKDTGNLVIALDFKKLNETTPRAYFRYMRRGKESIVLSDYATIEFSSGTFTAVIPKVPHLRLDLAEIHADIDDALPPFAVGPNAINSTDPAVQTSFARLMSDIPLAIAEYFLFKVQLFTAIYIQENICDFGLKLISV